MLEIPSPILIFGDVYVSKNNIIAAKKKYHDAKWVTKSADSDSLDNIRMEYGSCNWDGSDKILIVQDIPNRKQVRDFLINLSESPSNTKLIIWDSNNCIKIDPETKTIEKSWAEFVDLIRKIKNSKIINNGEKLNEKNDGDTIDFVIKCFENKGKVINAKTAKVLVNVVGHDRGMLDSDIKKMSLVCPDHVDVQFILDNAFPSTKESVLYKIGNALDTGNYEHVIDTIERFLASGINPNVIMEIFIKKSRWQMAVAHLWSSGLSWERIPDYLMSMGKFPSAIWHNDNIDDSRKKSEALVFQDEENIYRFVNRNLGIPSRYIKKNKSEAKSKGKTKITRKNSEIIPMYFMAAQTVDLMKKIALSYGNIDNKKTKEELLSRTIRVYLFIQDKMVSIRANENSTQDLQEMARLLTR